MTFTPELISGTTVHYYVTCKREAWLYAHKVSADQSDENILMGKALAEIKEKDLHQFPFSNLKFDKIGKERGHYLVTEYKKSFKNPEGAKMQLLFYMYLLKKNLKLKEINGKVISGKKVIYVEGSEENMQMMEKLLEEIATFVSNPLPPKPKKIPFCKKCGYRDYCF
ncbi:CRISPR-associated protein Cas4 [Hydrogenimonas thermophila]|uniref:CRISPR-associated protein Cas4 n=1 Tax=Hydrogenimonas thermophila TaxID=223786 RepID=UPI00293706E3|nr:CRISPR-associated protein Cas4 [Hydrogenimonas thermophila]WOE71222.1 CRISPR-associated protein Cas4 [Hydrogenimonas thermophila]WOE73742.1 CRISPR-associated protein Cas4 [Hydrogenimonas thermophila]